MSTKITGGCKCGHVRYEGDRADAPMFRCYCRDCQQLNGAGHSEMLPLIAGTFSVVGAATEYKMISDSGRPTWSSFCATCGSQLTRRSQYKPDRLNVHAGSLDDPKLYQPEMSIYESSAQPWDCPSNERDSD